MRLIVCTIALSMLLLVAEAVGQALHYAYIKSRKSGIVLIIENASDEKYLKRLINIVQYWELPIDVWTITSGEVQQ